METLWSLSEMLSKEEEFPLKMSRIVSAAPTIFEAVC